MSQPAFIVWNSSLSIGIKAMDDQHQVMIKIINRLHEAIRTGNGDQELRKLIAQMVDYTRFHFSSEEDLLYKNNYPEYPVQKLEHTRFTQKVVFFQDQVQNGNIFLTTDVLTFLKEWWIKHIQGQDRKYTQYLIGKGVT